MNCNQQCSGHDRGRNDSQQENEILPYTYKSSNQLHIHKGYFPMNNDGLEIDQVVIN